MGENLNIQIPFITLLLFTLLFVVFFAIRDSKKRLHSVLLELAESEYDGNNRLLLTVPLKRFFCFQF